jgi:inner membrane protein
MDSVTQFALGASIGTAVLGRRLGLRKAALTGGLLATLPDLDVFWPEADPVERFVSHRSATHSLIVHCLVTPLLGEGLRRTIAPLKNLPWKQGCLLAWGVVFLCLTTHALLDATTIYGTQLLWPLNRVPYAIGSMFIIDPLYTLPLLIMTVWALCLKQGHPAFTRWLKVSLIVSTLYLGWSIVAQQWMEDRGREILADAGLAHSQLIATPTPFNSLLWRVIAIDNERYYNIYLPAFADANGAAIYQQRRLSPGCWLAQVKDPAASVHKLARFSRGYFSLTAQGKDLIYADLRMGMTPYYVFSYKVAKRKNGTWVDVPAMRLAGLPRTAEGDFGWLWAGIKGQQAIRPSEKAQMVAPSDVISAASLTQTDGISCARALN